MDVEDTNQRSMKTTFEQLPYDQQLIAMALLEEERIMPRWIKGYYVAETLNGKTFQGKGQFRTDTCIDETPTHYEWLTNTGTKYLVDKKTIRWIPTPIPPVQKDHLV